MASGGKVLVDVVSDTVCPWCFIGKRRLETAIRQLQVYRILLSSVRLLEVRAPRMHVDVPLHWPSACLCREDGDTPFLIK